MKFSVQSEVDPEVKHLLVNRTRIKQAIYGILSNAMQFSPDHSDIVFSAKKTADGGSRLSVKDRGIGMEHEQVKTIVDGTEVTLDLPGKILLLRESENSAAEEAATVNLAMAS